MRRMIAIAAALTAITAAAFDAAPLLGWVLAADEAFDPTSIDDCHLWLDAADADTVQADSGAVTNWMDKSGKGNNAVQVGGAVTRPTTGAATLNSRNVISFDGGDYLGTAYTASSNMACFVVLRATNFATFRYFIGAYTTGTLRNYAGVNGSDSLVQIYNGSGAEAEFTWGSTARVYGYYGSGNTAKVRIGGAEVTSFAYTGGPPTHPFAIGGFNNAGTYTARHTGIIAEVLIYDRVLTASEIGRVEKYLADKWGL